MTASHIGDLEISRFTLAILKDTNWYKGINLDIEDTMFFGKNRGCSFILKSCKSNGKFREYCGVFSADEYRYHYNYGRGGCTYDWGGMGVCIPEYFSNLCMSVLGFEDYYCYDEANNNRPAFKHVAYT